LELGRPVEYVDIPVEAWRQALSQVDVMTPWLIEHLSCVAESHQHGDFDAVADVVETIGGVLPSRRRRSFAKANPRSGYRRRLEMASEAVRDGPITVICATGQRGGAVIDALSTQRIPNRMVAFQDIGAVPVRCCDAVGSRAGHHPEALSAQGATRVSASPPFVCERSAARRRLPRSGEC
jgi:rhodanese-related sulfurtransferase